MSATLNIDFTSDYQNFLSPLIEFLIVKDLILVAEDWELIPLNTVQLENKLLRSSNYIKYKKLILNSSNF